MAQVTPSELGRLIDQQSRALRLFAAQWTNAADDAVQEAFIELAAQSEGPDDPVSWLFGVVRNKARLAARGDRRRRQREQSVSRMTMDWFEPSPEVDLDTETAATALNELHEDLREVIVARIWGNLSFEQIAEVVGSSSSTVHRRFLNGLEQLRKRLGLTWITKQNSTTN